MVKQEFLRLPVVSAGAEFLVMGYLMRRNILTYKAPSNNDGYDLICIHPNPRLHAMLAPFLPETSCERGNKYLDRSELVPTVERINLVFLIQ